jgi:hypothetical protein
MKNLLFCFLLFVSLSCSFKEIPEATFGWWTLTEVIPVQRVNEVLQIQVWENIHGQRKRVVVTPGNHYKCGDRILSFNSL